MPGLFIAFEGIDGSGKSTQVELLADYARSLGIDPLMVREPGGTELGEQLRQILLSHASDGMSGAAEALLYAASRAELVERVIRPAIDDGRLVIADRFVGSSLAYQGAGRGLGVDRVRAANELAVGSCEPDIVVHVAVPAELARSRRLAAGDGEDRIEAEQAEFFERVNDCYAALAADDEATNVVVDGSPAAGDVHHEVVESLAGQLVRALASRAGQAASGA